jgi:hypothetical protein
VPGQKDTADPFQTTDNESVGSLPERRRNADLIEALEAVNLVEATATDNPNYNIAHSGFPPSESAILMFGRSPS